MKRLKYVLRAELVRLKISSIKTWNGFFKSHDYGTYGMFLNIYVRLAVTVGVGLLAMIAVILSPILLAQLVFGTMSRYIRKTIKRTKQIKKENQ